MKNIKFLFLLVATLAATAFTACEQEWEPGQPDSELSVYFPVDVDIAPFAKRDDKSTSHDERKTAAYKVYRQNGGEEMTVEIRSRFINPDDVVFRKRNDLGQIEELKVSDAFTVAESVTFAAGENFAELYVDYSGSIDDLSVGDMFPIEIMVKDVKHQGHYGLYRKTINLGIPETWKVLGTEYKDDLKFGTFTEDFFTFLYGGAPGNRIKVTIEESEARKGVYRIKNLFSKDNVVQMLGGVPSDMSFAKGDTYIIIDASNSSEVYIPWQYCGFGIPGYMDQIYIASGKAIGADNAKLEKGKVVFPANTVGILDASGSGRYTNESGLMAMTLPGVSVKDYSLQMSFVGTETTADNSQTRAYFNYYVGEDVSKYRFVVVEGSQEAYTSIKEGLSEKVEQNKAVAAMLASEYDANGDPDFEKIADADVKKMLENSAEVDASFVDWYITLPKASIYTMFAVAYDEAGKLVVDDNNRAIVARTHFYYHPANENHEGGVPDLKTPNIKFTTINDIMTAGITDSKELEAASEYYKMAYPACFYLGFDIQTDEADYVSQLAWYYTKTADMPEGVDPYTLEGQKTLINKHAGEDSDISYQISYLKAGGSPMVISATPDTDYTVVLAVTSIYGKTSYYTVEARTAPYSFNTAYGKYSFEDGDSKMTLEIEPFYNANEYQKTGCGELFYMKWIVEDKGPYTAIREYPFIGFKMPEYNAIVTYGQVNGYAGSFFAVDMPVYNEEGNMVPSKKWGFQSSSKASYEYDYESMVLKYDENGVIYRLDTYFRQYVKTTTVTTDPVTKEEVTKTTTEYVNVFTPDNTTVTWLDKKPAAAAKAQAKVTRQPASFSYGAGRISNPTPVQLQMLKNFSLEAMSIM